MISTRRSESSTIKNRTISTASDVLPLPAGPHTSARSFCGPSSARAICAATVSASISLWISTGATGSSKTGSAICVLRRRLLTSLLRLLSRITPTPSAARSQ